VAAEEEALTTLQAPLVVLVAWVVAGQVLIGTTPPLRSQGLQIPVAVVVAAALWIITERQISLPGRPAVPGSSSSDTCYDPVFRTSEA
jgi:hypothetical protein